MPSPREAAPLMTNQRNGGCGCSFFLLIYLLVAWYFSIWPFLSGGFHPLRFESHYHVYLYDPAGNEVYLGRVHGISEGQDLAASEAHRLGLTSSARWDYILCKITRTSDCYSKHK